MKWHKIKSGQVHLRHGVYLTSFLFNLQAALLAYISSSFIGKFISLDYLGLVYALSALLAIFVLSQMSKILARWGNFRVITFILILTVVILTGLASVKIAWLVAALFITYQAILSFSRVNFDIYLEKLSQPKETGSVRGAYLTIVNSSWVFAPLITGFLVGATQNYNRAFLAGTLVAAAALLVALFK